MLERLQLLLPNEGFVFKLRITVQTSQPSTIRIAVDAMGGDHAPKNVVAGALEALQESRGRLSLLLVGQAGRVREELGELSNASGTGDGWTVVDAKDVIDMHDSPNAALRTKKDSSLTVGIQLHREGSADAFVSAGNTGAVLSASTLILGRIKGVARPTIGALIPTEGTPCMLVDAGTNVDCKPRHLFEFAVMGSIYVSSMLGKTNPTVGLLNIGEEDIKGNEVSVETFGMLRKSKLNFVGNIEGRDILKGKVDVAVCDGFIGNILLKFGESVPVFLKARLGAFAKKGLMNALRVWIARSGLKAVMKELDYQEYGGVPLLGVNGVSVIGHGGSTPKAIKNMILRAEEMVQRKVNFQIQQAILTYS